MYAIVDIETTGGYAAASGITEVAILVFDGKSIVNRYETLVNPGVEVPRYITALTGIDDAMLIDAPSFDEVAADIMEILRDTIFVAHNVNFDYSFLQHYLARSGYTLQNKKLCTVRLSKKIFPGYPSYSLGKLCTSMKIPMENRHRAGGDAEATVKLFSMLLEHDTENHITTSLSRNSKEQVLPPHLPKEQITQIPYTPGVYYFHDQKGKVIYVGKAKNIHKRVCSHFSGNSAGKQRQEFMRDIYSISFEECGTELMALILEATEIKRLWPSNNRALKRFEQKYGLYTFEDQNGYLRLSVDKHKKFMSPAYSFNTIMNGYNTLNTLVKEFELCPKLCFIQTNTHTCTGIEEGTCRGACEGKESVKRYNKRVQKALDHLRQSLPSFIIKDAGRSRDESSYLMVEEGKFVGMGYLSDDSVIEHPEALKIHLKAFPSNDYILNMILSYADTFPEKVIYTANETPHTGRYS